MIFFSLWWWCIKNGPHVNKTFLRGSFKMAKKRQIGTKTYQFLTVNRKKEVNGNFVSFYSQRKEVNR